MGGLSDMAYTGEQLRPVPTVTLGGKTLTASADYEVTYGENVRGQGSVYIWGVGSHIGSKLVTFDIVGNGGSDEGEDYEGEDTDGSDDGDDEGVYDLADADVYNVASRVYTGKAQVQSPTVLLDGVPLDEGDDYVISYKNNVNAGNATMTLEGVGAYTGSQSLTFTISRASVKGSTAAKVAAKKYTGKAIKPNPKLTFKGRTLQKGKDYTLAYKNNKKRGTATITVKGKGNFKGSKAVKFKIK